MTVIARRIASIPARLASDTWLSIVDLLAPTKADARAELFLVTGIASSIITRETMKDSPILVVGDGPRIRIYCVYGTEAIEGAKVNEAQLPSSPTESTNWTVSLPCPSDDLSWVRSSLKELSARVTARDVAEVSLLETDDETAATGATIDVESFFRT